MEFKDSTLRLEQQPYSQRYAIGFYDKDLGKVRIVETPTLFRLQQRIKDLKPTESYGREPTTGREAAQALIEAFGSRKKQAMLRSRQMNELATERVFVMFFVFFLHVMTPQLQAVVSDSVHKTLATKAAAAPAAPDVTVDESQLLPPFDPEATDPALIYNIDDCMLDARVHAVCLRLFVTVIPPAHWAHLDPDPLLHALTHPDHLASLRASNEYACLFVCCVYCGTWLRRLLCVHRLYCVFICGSRTGIHPVC